MPAISVSANSTRRVSLNSKAMRDDFREARSRQALALSLVQK
jgi:hypothetical protein